MNKMLKFIVLMLIFYMIFIIILYYEGKLVMITGG